MVGEDYTNADIEKIIKATTGGFDTFQDLIELFSKRKKFSIGKTELDLMKKAIADKDQILDRARKQMK